MKRSATYLPIFLLLGACTYWPPEGNGGQAELFDTATAGNNNLRIENAAAIECFDRMIQDMSVSAVADYYPGELNNISVAWTRAVRAHAGRLDEEAQIDLMDLRSNISTLGKKIAGNGQIPEQTLVINVKEPCL
ncbi:MAG: hypothetical protein R3261_04885 [Alphaproteobacteria bacterium]|nr:hypothetical protein [Alphaproteobacteria bacterium]